jgi:hypothetical protein
MGPKQSMSSKKGRNSYFFGPNSVPKKVWAPKQVWVKKKELILLGIFLPVLFVLFEVHGKTDFAGTFFCFN